MAAAVTLKIFRLVDFLFYDSAPPDKSAASTDTVVKLIRISASLVCAQPHLA
jgi:hypothetical protein